MGKKKVDPDVVIMLDKRRILRFDLNAMVKFEEVTGKNLFDGTFSGSGMPASDLRAMLWACLLHEDGNMSLEDIGALVSPKNIEMVAVKLGEAFEAATGSPEVTTVAQEESTSPLAK